VSQRRTRTDAGWGNSRDRKRGPNGRGLCRWCKNEVPKGRQTFCGPACVHEWRIRTDPGYVRHCVEKRDRAKCSRCGLDTLKLERGIDQLLDAWKVRKVPDGTRWFSVRLVLDEKLISRVGPLWEAHHGVAVVEGGGECGLDGYETLCLWCHRDETRKLAGRRVSERRGDLQPDPLPGMK
jgi:hypothetical protein